MSLRKCAQCLGAWDLGSLDSNRGKISTFAPCPGFPISARQEGHTWEDSLDGAFALGGNTGGLPGNLSCLIHVTHNAAGLGTVNDIQCKKVSGSNRPKYHCSRDSQVPAREASSFAGVRMARPRGRLGVS